MYLAFFIFVQILDTKEVRILNMTDEQDCLDSKLIETVAQVIKLKQRTSNIRTITQIVKFRKAPLILS